MLLKYINLTYNIHGFEKYARIIPFIKKKFKNYLNTKVYINGIKVPENINFLICYKENIEINRILF